MSNLKIYGFFVSQPTRSILMLAKAAGIEHEYVSINIMAGEQRADSYLKINPNGLVPCIQEGDFCLAEGAAILQYLAESRNLTSWYPTDPQARARVNYWLHWHHSNTRRSTTKFLHPALFKKPVDEAEVQLFKNSLQLLDNQLEKTTYLASDSAPTIADLMIIPELDQLQEDCFALFDYSPYKNIVRYLEDVKNSVSSYNDVYTPVCHLAASKK